MLIDSGLLARSSLPFCHSRRGVAHDHICEHLPLVMKRFAMPLSLHCDALVRLAMQRGDLHAELLEEGGMPQREHRCDLVDNFLGGRIEITLVPLLPLLVPQLGQLRGGLYV